MISPARRHLAIRQVREFIDSPNGGCAMASPSPSSSTRMSQASSSQDYDRWLEQLAPYEPVSQYRHNDTSDDNADADIVPQVLVLGKTPGDGPRGSGGYRRRQARFRPLGAGLLQGIRRAETRARAGQDHRRIKKTTGLTWTSSDCRTRRWKTAPTCQQG